ncbi:hypothetical protein, partial [Legionella birminghamensis]|uniref:hypothetical protein n=1 Tax=Legionella birminghamensis TaxID=28083 RepID=UPI001ED99846
MIWLQLVRNIHGMMKLKLNFLESWVLVFTARIVPEARRIDSSVTAFLPHPFGARKSASKMLRRALRSSLRILSNL